jgi:hypothetical protein
MDGAHCIFSIIEMEEFVGMGHPDVAAGVRRIDLIPVFLVGTDGEEWESL